MTTQTDSPAKICFVVGPIGSPDSDFRRHADWLLEEIIRPVFDQYFADFFIVRADKESLPGLITSQLISHLVDDELVIADISFTNPNAFYEMGIRHMAQKPIIHMYLRGTEIPFDVKPYRAIEFAYSEPSELKAARAALKDAVSTTMAPGFVVENPVTAARGKVELERHATPEIKLIWSKINEIENKLIKPELSLSDVDHLIGSASVTSPSTVIMLHTTSNMEGDSCKMLDAVLLKNKNVKEFSLSSTSNNDIVIRIDGKHLTRERIRDLVRDIGALPFVKEVTYWLE